MNLDVYRKKLERRMVWIRLALVIFLVVELVVSRLVEDNAATSYVWGMCVGGALMGLVVMARIRRSLKDEGKLRRLWIDEHDERMQAIRAKAGVPMVIYLSLGLSLTAAVVIFFNETVAITLILAALAQLAVSLVVKLVCMKRM